MAAAVRLARAGASIAVVPLGDFGRRVAALLSATGAAHCHIAEDGAVREAFAAETDIVVAALWRPSPALCEQADSLSFARGRPWLPVTMDHPVLHVGPLVVPPAGPCYQCYLRRRAQHDRQHATTRALYAAFDADAGCGPAGFLPQHARLAASVATALIRHCAPVRAGVPHPAPAGRTAGLPQPAAAGTVVSAGLSGHGLTSAPVVPCHDCGRCGPGRERGRAPAAGEALMRLAAGLGSAGWKTC